MSHKSRTGLLISLGAAAGVAAMMSAATAPTARADDFTDVINAVDTDFTTGQADFSDAVTAFEGNADLSGLTDFFDGLNEDFLASSTNLFAGTAELLDNEAVTGPIGLGVTPPTDFADAVSVAETLYQEGTTEMTDAANAFIAGDYGYGVFYDLFGADIATVLPLEEILLGSVASL
jgi:hypothetical protein